MLRSPALSEDCQELTMAGLSPRFALAPVPRIPSLPNSSRNSFLHILPSSLGSSVLFFMPFTLHPTKSLICFAVPSGYHLTSLLFICQLLKQMVSICHCHLWFRQPPFNLWLSGSRPSSLGGCLVVFPLPNSPDSLHSSYSCVMLF